MGEHIANRLSGESSPYLLQHAGNPVDWYPWGSEALDRARSEGKPIFLSVGYSSCHWCHVMERESFEDADTASFLNAHFVSVKVDREERPDLDAVYMQAVQALTGQGGWPLSVWLTPEGVPFFGGTYFPPTPRRGMPSFRQVLEAIADTWQTRRSDLSQTAEALRDHLRRDLAADGPGSAGPGSEDANSFSRLLDAADAELHATLDPRQGGWGDAPKFPPPLVLEYLLARQTIQPEASLEHDIRLTLDAMASGGVYDHIGGGFHRYSTDGWWLVPHFEKMLYDNAQLARCYVHAWQSLGVERYRTIAGETLAYLLREMRHPQGGFYSGQDADTAEGEGNFFTWTQAEVRAALAEDEAAAIQRVYGLSERGDFEGRNILHLSEGTPAPDPHDPVLARARAKLLAVRNARPRPARDEKILASWNGLVIAALADAATALGSSVYLKAGGQAAEFLVSRLMPGATAAPGGPPLLHSWKDGRTSGPAFLDDYACAAEGLLALYRATYAERWFVAARTLTEGLLERFRRPTGGFYDTSPEHEALLTRPRAVYDSPTPTGNSMAARVLLEMAAYTGEDHFREAAEETLASLAAAAGRAPVMAGHWLLAALMASQGLIEVAIVGDPAVPQTEALLAVVHRGFRPLAMPAFRPPNVTTEIALVEREAPGGPAAWVCRDFTCATPTSDPAELRILLDGTGPRL